MGGRGVFFKFLLAHNIFLLLCPIEVRLTLATRKLSFQCDDVISFTIPRPMIVEGSDRHDIEYSKGIRSLQSRIEAQALLEVGVCVCELRCLVVYQVARQ